MTSAEDADLRARRAYAAGELGITGLHARLGLIASGDPGAISQAAAGLPAMPPRNPARGGHHLWLPADLDVIASLAAISDPHQRLLAAAHVNDAEYLAQQETRQRQVIAAVAAHVRHGASQVSCYEAIDMGRQKFRARVKQAPSDLPDFGSAVAALDEAAREQQAYERHRARAQTARLVRDREIRALTSGAYGTKVKAIRIAEDLNTTKANISWIVNQPVAA